jgi:PrtD family type I secretion system ABC transporter
MGEIALFSFIVNVMLLAMPIYLLQIYDRVLPSSSMDTLVYLSVMVGCALLLLAILETVRGIFANRIAARIGVAYGRQAVLASMDSPRASLGDVQPLRDLTAIRKFFGSPAILALFDLPFSPLFIGLMWFIHPWLFVITVSGAIVLCILAIANQQTTSSPHKAAALRSNNAMMTSQSFARNAESLKAMGMTEAAVQQWGDQYVLELEATDRAKRMNSVFSGLSRLMRLLLQMAVLGVAAWLVINGEMTPGMIFAASLISGRGLQPIDQVIGGWTQYVEAAGAWMRFKAATRTAKGDRAYTQLPEPKGKLAVENLVYMAPNSPRTKEPILKRLNFQVPAGNVVVVAGPSGAGKSTLARLLVGAIKPSAGVVRIDGADIDNWNPLVLGRHIGYVPQDVELLPGTIAQNIARFRSNADDAEIVDAAKRAQVHDLIMSLSNGYDTFIGPQGLILSGGQRQRIGLARAMFGSPCLLVLDEPNAHLDADGEAALGRMLDESVDHGTTIIMITQRSLAAGRVDLLLLLRNGLIEKFGPRDQVAAYLEQKAKSSADTLKQAASEADAAEAAPLSLATFSTGLRVVGNSDKPKS